MIQFVHCIQINLEKILKEGRILWASHHPILPAYRENIQMSFWSLWGGLEIKEG